MWQHGVSQRRISSSVAAVMAAAASARRRGGNQRQCRWRRGMAAFKHGIKHPLARQHRWQKAAAYQWRSISSAVSASMLSYHGSIASAARMRGSVSAKSSGGVSACPKYRISVAISTGSGGIVSRIAKRHQRGGVSAWRHGGGSANSISRSSQSSHVAQRMLAAACLSKGQQRQWRIWQSSKLRSLV